METIKRLPTHPGDVLKEEIESRGITMQNRYNMAFAKQKPTLRSRLLNIRKVCAAVL